MIWVAVGVVRKRRNDQAVRDERSLARVETCHSIGSGNPATSMGTTELRRTSPAARWVTAGAMPASSSAAAANAAVWLGSTRTLLSGTRSLPMSWKTGDDGSVPAGSTSQSTSVRAVAHRPRAPASRLRGLVSSCSEQRMTGWLSSCTEPSPVSFGPSATSASRSWRKACISAAVATPTVASLAEFFLVKVSTSDGTTYSAMVDEARIRSSGAAPRAWRTVAWASAPRWIISEAMGTRRRPAEVSSIPVGPRASRGSPRCWRSAPNVLDTAGSLTPRARAAAVTDPRRATRTKHSNCVSVTRRVLTRRFGAGHAQITDRLFGSSRGSAAGEAPRRRSGPE